MRQKNSPTHHRDPWAKPHFRQHPSRCPCRKPPVRAYHSAEKAKFEKLCIHLNLPHRINKGDRHDDRRRGCYIYRRRDKIPFAGPAVKQSLIKFENNVSPLSQGVLPLQVIIINLSEISEHIDPRNAEDLLMKKEKG